MAQWQAGTYGPQATVRGSEKLALNTSELNWYNRIHVFSRLVSSHAAIGVGKILFLLFALALDLPETYFDDKVGLSPCRCDNLLNIFQTQNAAAIMRVLHYPLQDGHPGIDDDTPGIGAHSEYLLSFYSVYLNSFLS
jgi:isopenicillin N synthase-like dioxygenase